MNHRTNVTRCCAALLVLLGVTRPLVEAAPPTQVDQAAVERTRKQVRMLDDIYKTAVVLITTHYVEEESDVPAGTAAKKLFAAIEQKGWHKVRLIDATGEPYSEKNVAEDDFEKRAVQQLTAGKTYLDEVITQQGRPYLRAATPIPVVMEKCTLCHPHYKNVPAGKPIGILGYTLPIE